RLQAVVVVLTYWEQVNAAVEAMKMGAFDYLTMPVDPQKLKAVLDSCVEQIEMVSLAAAFSGHVFLSYAREDATQTRRVYERLKVAGFSPWMDIEDLSPGEQWRPAIESAIRRASLFLACLSEHSVTKRGMVQRELQIALDVWQEHLQSDIYLIPVRLTDCL